MINPISKANAIEPSSQPPPPKPDHQAQTPQTVQTVKSGTVSRDQVTLKSAGQVDGDNK
jgi:hypothetical protein